jgi:hypothetical protein
MFRSINKWFTLAAVIFLASCASTHDLSGSTNNYLGGGYKVKKIDNNIYSIRSKTNFAPWVNESGASNSWHDRATEVCNGKNYKAV